MIESVLWEKTRELYKAVVRASKLALVLSEESKNTGRPMTKPSTTVALQKMAEQLLKENA